MNAARVVFHLNDGAALDEEAGEIDGFVEIAAPVPPQIQNQAVDSGLLEFHDQAGDVLRGAGLAAVAVGISIGGRPVKGGQGDDTERTGDVVGAGDLENRGMGALGIQFYHVARDDDGAAYRGVGGVGRLDEEMNLGAFFAADHFHDLAKFHADDFDRLGPGLPDGDNAVVGLELTSEVRRSAGDEFFDDAVVIFHREHRADTDELKFHLDAEFLEGFRGEIGRMRVIEPGDATQVDFGEVTTLGLAETLEHLLVAFAHRLLGFLDRLLVQKFGNKFELEPSVPKFVRIDEI